MIFAFCIFSTRGLFIEGRYTLFFPIAKKKIKNRKKKKDFCVNVLSGVM